jgi:hypothetical protein
VSVQIKRGGQGRDRTADLPLFRWTCARFGVVCAGQAGCTACNQTCWISSSDSLAPSWPHEMTLTAPVDRVLSCAAATGAALVQTPAELPTVTWLEDLTNLYTPTSALFDGVRRHQAAIESRLNATLGILEMFEIGSLRHGTGVWRFSDADYLVSLTGLRPASRRPAWQRWAPRCWPSHRASESSRRTYLARRNRRGPAGGCSTGRICRSRTA